MELGNHPDKDTFHSCLEDRANGNEYATAALEALVISCSGYTGGSGGSQAFNQSTQVDEEVNDSAWVERCVHGEVVHEPSEDIVFSC